MPNWPEGGQAAAAELRQAHVNKNGDWRVAVESVQDFLMKLDMKPSSGNKHFFTKSCYRQI